ncbi:fibrinolytic enzyme isozyme C-like isoform X2 [Biomphalaria glabrata]|nr:fibrinolytic enzyme; isozyme C-like isoform X2 [Biomphalaria glabrata]
MNLLIATSLVLLLADISVTSSRARHSIGGFNKRIIYGKNAELYDIPYQVGIFVRGKKEWNLLCGGVLIKIDKVLTAAHCMEDETAMNTKVAVGLLDSVGAPTQYEQFIYVKKIKIHEGYENVASDLAILTLATPAILNNNVKVAQLADDSSDFVDTPCIISGWGRNNYSDNAFPNRLQKTSVMLLSQEECIYYWSDQSEGIDNKEFVCVASEQGDSTSCNGDSGGPLLCGPNLDKLVGVLSFGTTNCPTEYPVVYTDVTQYHRSWIEKNS